MLCEHPMVEGATGYRYGCRCPRCLAGHKRGRRMSPICHEPGCEEQRLKGRRTCARHAPAPIVPPSVRRIEPCELCGRPHGWYESQLAAMGASQLPALYRRVCNGCRRLYLGAIKAHRLDADTAIRLILAEACDLCDAPFSIARNGRANVYVDHDHACCSRGRGSCGACVRGFLCVRCNQAVAHLEALQEVGLDRALSYVERFA